MMGLAFGIFRHSISVTTLAAQAVVASMCIAVSAVATKIRVILAPALGNTPLSIK